ncbi:hypothetical protein [Streptomyces sp. NPDC050564]|uniref:hypothetical protein n=1 Tax=Streptomyces sp. NPDC050564 TaxID=3365631 RepID=UPI0037A5A3EE
MVAADSAGNLLGVPSPKYYQQALTFSHRYDGLAPVRRSGPRRRETFATPSAADRTQTEALTLY